MSSKQISLPERTLFLSGVTFLGGFLDTYTYVTRGGVFANNHTGNMAKLGITLAQGNWMGAVNCFLPIVACMMGAVASEFTKHHTPVKFREWRKIALAAELIALFIVGLIPTSIPDVVVNTALSFITGFQLCLFRTSQWGAHNTTICTGNLRTTGQYLYGAVSDKTPESWTRFIKYSLIVFSFVVGAGVGVPLCNWLGNAASIFGSLIIAGLLTAIIADEKHMQTK